MPRLAFVVRSAVIPPVQAGSTVSMVTPFPGQAGSKVSMGGRFPREAGSEVSMGGRFPVQAGSATTTQEIWDWNSSTMMMIKFDERIERNGTTT